MKKDTPRGLTRAGHAGGQGSARWRIDQEAGVLVVRMSRRRAPTGASPGREAEVKEATMLNRYGFKCELPSGPPDEIADRSPRCVRCRRTWVESCLSESGLCVCCIDEACEHARLGEFGELEDE